MHSYVLFHNIAIVRLYCTSHHICLLYSVSLISMEFQLKQLYLIEGLKPICIQVDVQYNVENGDQDYLWPVKILAKGRLTTCNKRLSKIKYLPIRHYHFFVSTGVLNVIVCAFGIILHCFKLLAFIVVGKVSNVHIYILHINLLL